MDGSRSQLLDRVLAEVSANGLADRSLRDLAAAIGSSHRMLHYHFGSRAGLVAAVVNAIEAAQRELLLELAERIDDPVELARALWARTAAPEMLPFVRLFFECVGLTGGAGLTDPWLALSTDLGRRLGDVPDADEFRLGVAVTRGLLIDVLATGDATEATRAFERYLAMWQAATSAGVEDSRPADAPVGQAAGPR